MNSTGNFNPQKQMQRIFISFLEANRREAERKETNKGVSHGKTLHKIKYRYKKN